MVNGGKTLIQLNARNTSAIWVRVDVGGIIDHRGVMTSVRFPDRVIRVGFGRFRADLPDGVSAFMEGQAEEVVGEVAMVSLASARAGSIVLMIRPKWLSSWANTARPLPGLRIS